MGIVQLIFFGFFVRFPKGSRINLQTGLFGEQPARPVRRAFILKYDPARARLRNSSHHAAAEHLVQQGKKSFGIHEVETANFIRHCISHYNICQLLSNNLF